MLAFAQQLSGAVMGVQHTVIMQAGMLVHADCGYQAIAPLLRALASSTPAMSPVPLNMVPGPSRCVMVTGDVSALPVYLQYENKEERLYLAVCQVCTW